MVLQTSQGLLVLTKKREKTEPNLFLNFLKNQGKLNIFQENGNILQQPIKGEKLRIF